LCINIPDEVPVKFKIGSERKNRTADIGSVLPDILKEFNLGENYIIEKIRDLWPGITSNIIATHSIPDRIFRKTLFVKADHSVYSNELTLLKDTIIERVNSELKMDMIKNIRVEIDRLKWENEKSK